ncbi:MAG: endonuclease domain-containing protein [Alphaproteobacteria bacterium]|nr:endonuclease domain-containing protein [Alphaproteobacteria bacterium]
MRGGPVLTARARRLRGNMTEAERLLWNELRRSRLGWRFRRQFPVPPYVADFACLEARLIVEADGGQHARTGDHDRRDMTLRRAGWRVLRFWNNEIFENCPGVLETISNALGPRSQEHPHPNHPPPAGEGVSAAPSAALSSFPPRQAREGVSAPAAAPSSSPPPQAGEG